MKVLWRNLEMVEGFGVLCGEKRELGNLVVFKFGVNEEKSEKLKIFNPDSAFMSRHKVGMPRDKVKFFSIYLSHAAAWIIHAVACWMLVVFSFFGHTRGMKHSCRSMLLSSF